ncbi:MAG: glycoside hydrolase 100 family protein [bacterium]|nr:glycoside hydrolase 100 family protein [bacterium]
MKLIEQGYQQAINVCQHCAKPSGFFASGLPEGYQSLWARDSMITSLGACLIDKKFKTPFKKSLELLSKHQSQLGQIPNAVGDYNFDRKSKVTFNTIDSTLWYLIGHYAYSQSYKDKTLLKKYEKNIDQAFLWLSYQDPNEDKLLVQQPTMDWQDAFPHKYGRVINTQALYYAVLKMFNKNKLAQRIKKIVNGEIEKYLSLYNEKTGYYHPWIWKNHDRAREQGEWFDTAGNLLAIVTGLATPKISNKILNYIEKEKINKPYPCKAIFPPLKPGDKEWQLYFSEVISQPGQYLNGGVWPFIGGFYVVALVKTGKYSQAEKELKNLADCNNLGGKREWEFNEWLDGKTGQPKGAPYQGWSAGAYIFAFESLRRKKVLFFN